MKWLAAAAAAVAVTISLAFVLVKPAAGACSPQSADAIHAVYIRDGIVTPSHTEAKLCEQLQIINLDSQDRLVAFGPHEDHVPYDGIAERLLAKNQSLTVTLVQTGSFRFHDHLDDSVQGTFSVAK